MTRKYFITRIYRALGKLLLAGSIVLESVPSTTVLNKGQIQDTSSTVKGLLYYNNKIGTVDQDLGFRPGCSGSK